jgi:adenosylmethionine-8-amino-7-oxononanoate aminotransferase
MKEVCDKYGVLFILDEVMSGMGRTGTLHAWEQEGVVPHLQTVAKGLGAGYEPIGALLVHKSVVDVLESGTKSFVHSQTYQGHPMACAAALEVQKVIEEENLLENVQTLGPILGELLRKALGDHQYVGDIRGRGFMWAVRDWNHKYLSDVIMVDGIFLGRVCAGPTNQGAVSCSAESGGLDPCYGSRDGRRHLSASWRGRR